LLPPVVNQIKINARDTGKIDSKTKANLLFASGREIFPTPVHAFQI
jgi:hypothetical protein